MSYFKIIGFTMCALTAIVLLKRVKEEYAMFISLIAGISLTYAALSILKPVQTYILEISENPHINSYFSLILKSTGVAIVTTIASDLCKDSGESALAGRLEMCAKALILSLALPLVKNVFDSCLILLG